MSIMNIIKDNSNILKYGDIQPIADPASYHEFTSMKEADEWGKEKYSDWAESYKEIFLITAQYKEGSILHVVDPVDMYLGYEYERINDYLRTGEPADSDYNIRIRISNLIMAISCAPVIGQKIVLYRQVPAKMIEEMIGRNKGTNQLPYQEKGFMSTSLLKTSCAKSCGNSEYMLKIYVEDFCPIHAIYANVIRGRDEAELLLPPGLFMRMAGYPYKDEGTGKTIYETQLFSMNSLNGK